MTPLVFYRKDCCLSALREGKKKDQIKCSFKKIFFFFFLEKSSSCNHELPQLGEFFKSAVTNTCNSFCNEKQLHCQFLFI